MCQRTRLPQLPHLRKKHLIHPEYGFCIDSLLFSFRPFLDESPLIPVSLTKPTSGGQFLWRFVQSKPTSQLVSLYILEETRSDEDKPRKNCEACPSYSLTVRNKPAMSFEFLNLSGKG